MISTKRLLFALAVCSFGLSVAAEDRPNVILIMADDLGYGDLSCYGSTLNRTPRLDRLAENGVQLGDYHSGSTVCTPSRMALLSGYYPRRVGWPGGVLGYRMDPQGGLSEEVRTLAEVFRAAGYRTGISGKWHLGSSAERLPRAQGFDEALIIRMSNNQCTKLWRDEELVADPFDNRRLTETFMNEAEAFVRRHRDRPFFLYLPLTAPHFPVEAHPDWDGRSNNAAFGDVVEEMDARVGRLVDLLEELGVEDRTVLVFTSDNGPQGSRKNKTTAKPLRGGKWSSLEGGTRVPCIWHAPGRLPAGRRYDGLMGSIDMLPTLAEACGVEWRAPKGQPPLDGMPLWAALAGRDQAPERGSLMLWDGWAHPHALRQGPWKLFFETAEDVPDSAAGPVLFDLREDLQERSNLAAEHPERVAGMKQAARAVLGSIASDSIPLGGGEPTPAVDPPSWLE
jgi:uncharacterized sulfatase